MKNEILCEGKINHYLRKSMLPSFIAGLCLASYTTTLIASETESRHGVVSMKTITNKLSIEGGANYTLQNANANGISNEAFAPFDLVISKKMWGGDIVAYIEANTTPSNDGVAAVIGDANGDVGSALDKNGVGTIQISELHYTREIVSSELTMGLVDLTGFFDINDYANDETTQFLAGVLVGNPSIEFPDYTLGLVYHGHVIADTLSLTAAVSSSHGIGDNDDPSYNKLFGVSEKRKGLFAAVQANYSINDNTKLNAGIWTNTADHENLDGSASGKINNGVFLNADANFGIVGVNARLGWANNEVSETGTFYSLATELTTPIGPIGLGLASSVLSADAKNTGMDNSTLTELYYRADLNDHISISPSIQFINNANFDSSGDVYDKSLTIYGIRTNVAF